jgi:hypothetical protein
MPATASYITDDDHPAAEPNLRAMVLADPHPLVKLEG